MSQPQSQDTPGFVQGDICPLARMGTWVAETIRASGHVNRANRPDTRPLLTKCRSLRKMACFAGAIHTGQSELATCNRSMSASIAPVQRTSIAHQPHQELNPCNMRHHRCTTTQLHLQLPLRFLAEPMGPFDQGGLPTASSIAFRSF